MSLLRSFRGRLALRFAATVLVLAIAGSTIGYVALRSILYERLDGLLFRLAGIEASATADSPDERVHFHDNIFRNEGPGHEAILSRYAEVWTLDGEPVLRTQNLAGRDLPLSAAIRRQVTAAQEPALFALRWDGSDYRAVLYPLGLAGPQHRLHLLEVVTATDQTDAVLFHVLAVLALLVTVGAACGGALGWWLAGYAVRPVADIIRQAERLDPDQPGHQIDARADTDELRRLVSVLNAMLARIDGVLAQQKQFLADAGHAIKTPLTVMRGDVDVALRQPRSADEYRGVLREVLGDLKDVSVLAEDLLTLARTDSGNLGVATRPVPLGPLFERLREQYRAMADDQGTAIEIVVPTLPTVQADEELLERTLSNLIDNALKYGRREGRIVLAAAPDGDDAIVIRVSDDGPGIAADDQLLVFKRFYRGDHGRRTARGSGLGLAIVRGIIERLGGSVTLEAGGNGTAVSLRLPAAPTL